MSDHNGLCIQKPLFESTLMDRSYTVMVVEDEPLIRDLLEELLIDEHYHVLAAANGHHALCLAEQYHPELFLLDYHLPDINGLMLYDHLHALVGCEGVPTLMMSADLPQQQELRKRSITGIRKPFELDHLIEQVRAVLPTPAT